MQCLLHLAKVRGEVGFRWLLRGILQIYSENDAAHNSHFGWNSARRYRNEEVVVVDIYQIRK
jgi:hypothetical protein